MISNYLDDDIFCKVLKFADDTNVLGDCVYIGHGNMDDAYKIGDGMLSRTTTEKI